MSCTFNLITYKYNLYSCKKYTLKHKMWDKKKIQLIKVKQACWYDSFNFFLQNLNTIHWLKSYFFLFSAVGNSVIPFPPKPQVPMPTRPLTLSGEANMLFFGIPFFTP